MELLPIEGDTGIAEHGVRSSLERGAIILRLGKVSEAQD